MAENFLVSWDSLVDGRYWTLWTAAFSHTWFLHFAINILVLNNFGRVLERILGRRFILSFYLVAAAVSSLSHALFSFWVLGEPSLPALGASGAISGFVFVFCLMFPKEIIYLFGFIPIPALIGALAFVGLDIWGIISQAQGGGLPIGHGAHLGGAITGVIWYFFKIRKHWKRKFLR